MRHAKFPVEGFHLRRDICVIILGAIRFFQSVSNIHQTRLDRVICGPYLVVQGPTTIRLPREPPTKAIQIARGVSIGLVEYRIAAEIVCIQKYIGKILDCK